MEQRKANEIQDKMRLMVDACGSTPFLDENQDFEDPTLSRMSRACPFFRLAGGSLSQFASQSASLGQPFQPPLGRLRFGPRHCAAFCDRERHRSNKQPGGIRVASFKSWSWCWHYLAESHMHRVRMPLVSLLRWQAMSSKSRVATISCGDGI